MAYDPSSVDVMQMAGDIGGPILSFGIVGVIVFVLYYLISTKKLRHYPFTAHIFCPADEDVDDKQSDTIMIPYKDKALLETDNSGLLVYTLKDRKRSFPAGKFAKPFGNNIYVYNPAPNEYRMIQPRIIHGLDGKPLPVFMPRLSREIMYVFSHNVERALRRAQKGNKTMEMLQIMTPYVLVVGLIIVTFIWMDGMTEAAGKLAGATKAMVETATALAGASDVITPP